MTQHISESLFKNIWKMFENDFYRNATATPTEYDFTKWWADNELTIPMRLILEGE